GLVHELAPRRRQLADPLDHRELAPAVGLHECVRRERLDVRAARERLARAGDDRDPDVGLRLDALPARAELVLQLLVHRVLPPGAIERDRRDAIGDVEADGLHAALANMKPAPDATDGASAFPTARRRAGVVKRGPPGAEAPGNAGTRDASGGEQGGAH